MASRKVIESENSIIPGCRTAPATVMDRTGRKSIFEKTVTTSDSCSSGLASGAGLPLVPSKKPRSCFEESGSVRKTWTRPS